MVVIGVHMVKKKILVVDDEPINRDILKAFLEDDYAVDSVNDGERCLEYLESNTPDMILLDLMMPFVDGYEVVKFLKSQENYANIPVIICSALDCRDDGRIDKNHYVDYITKPLFEDEVKRKVGEYI